MDYAHALEKGRLDYGHEIEGRMGYAHILEKG